MRESGRTIAAQSEARERRIAHWVLVTVSAFAIAAGFGVMTFKPPSKFVEIDFAQGPSLTPPRPKIHWMAGFGMFAAEAGGTFQQWLELEYQERRDWIGWAEWWATEGDKVPWNEDRKPAPITEAIGKRLQGRFVTFIDGLRDADHQEPAP